MSMRETSIRRAGLTVLAFTLFTRVIGFVRELVVAGTYGTTEIVDIYLAAITIPAHISTILYGSLPNAFVPLFAGNDGSDQRSRNVAWAVLAAMTILTAGVWIFARQVASLTSAGFDPRLQQHTIAILRIVAGTIFLSTVEALTRSRLIAQRRFVMTGLSSLWPSLAVIVAVAGFADGGAYTLAWGFLIGTGCMAVWNLAVGRYAQPEASTGAAPPAGRRTPGHWVISVMLISVTGLAFALIDRYLASFLSEGSMAVLKYADVIASQPRSIIAMALGIAIFPYLAENLKTGDRKQATTIINRAVRWSLLASVPAVVAMALLSEEIVTVLFERGRFDASSRDATAGVLVIYAFLVLPSVFTAIMDKVFYASMRWRPIMAGLLLSIVSKVLLSLWWVPLIGVRGLAASSAASGALFMAVMLIALPAWSWRPLWRDWLRLTVSAGALTAGACLLGRSVHALAPTLAWWPSALVSVLVAAVTTAAVLLILGPRLGMSEMRQVRDGVRALGLPRR